MSSDRGWHATIQDTFAHTMALLKPYVAEACLHYEDSAWALSDWLNILGPRLEGHGTPVTVAEVQFAVSLRDPDALQWADALEAQKRLYRLITPRGGTTSSMPAS